MTSRPPTPTTVPVVRDQRAARQPPQLHHCCTATCRVPASALADAHTRRSAPPRALAAPQATALQPPRHAPISDIMRLTSPIQRAGDPHSTHKSERREVTDCCSTPPHRITAGRTRAPRSALHHSPKATGTADQRKLARHRDIPAGKLPYRWAQLGSNQ
jgi:hypothetical protein